MGSSEPARTLRGLCGVLIDGVFGSLVIFFLLFILRVLLRSEWVAAVVWVLLLFPPTDLGGSWMIVWSMGLMTGVLIYFVLMRVGWVAYLFGRFVFVLLTTYPITFQTSAWYSGIGYAALFVVAAIALYGFRTSLGGRPLLAGAGVED